MNKIDYKINDVVEMKKPHPCQTRSTKFRIVEISDKVTIQCLGCNNLLTISKENFAIKIKKVIE